MMCSSVMSAHFLGKMVNEASINRKEARFHNNLTLHCGFNKEIEQIDGQLIEEDLFAIPFLKSLIFINLYKPFQRSAVIHAGHCQGINKRTKRMGQKIICNAKCNRITIHKNKIWAHKQYGIF